MKFTLKIESGNEGMSDPLDVVRAIRHIADKIEEHSPTWKAAGYVFDVNGNKVGTWEIRP